MELNVHAILRDSRVNGPGSRMAIWTQGCSKNCPNCFNPEIQTKKGGKKIQISELANDIINSDCNGVTFSGGDPLEQPKALLSLLTLLHNSDGTLNEKLPLGIIVFTGYTQEEISQIPDAKRCMEYIDLLIEGRYNDEQKQDHGLAGSSNQRFIFLDRPNRGRALLGDSVYFDQEVEIHYKKDSSDVYEMTGFPELNMEVLKSLGIEIIE